MSATVTEVDEDDLPSALRDGLDALRKTHPRLDVEPLIEKGNMVVVRLGTFEVTSERFDEDRDGQPLEHAHDEYEVFVRLPRNFPNGNIKGFGTSPPLERERRGVKNNPDWEPKIQDDHEEFHDDGDDDHGDDVEWYSWNWSDVPTDKPEHVKFAYDLAEQMLIYG